MVHRGFHYLHSRVLLHLQHEIRVLERELDQLDELDEDAAEEGRASRLQSISIDERKPQNGEHGRPRSHIISDIRLKLMEYGLSDINRSLELT